MVCNMYTVGEVSEVAGVTVRTLHHYDEIGLLRPSQRSKTGYRQYNDQDLERLASIAYQNLTEILFMFFEPRERSKT